MSNKFRPFSKRLTKRIIIVLTLTLALIFAGLFYLATSLTRNMNKDMFYCIMDTESEIVEKELYGVELSTRSSIRHMEQAVVSPDRLYEALEYELNCHPHIAGFFCAFEADYYPEKGRWYEPYAVRQGGTIVRRQVGSAEHDYHNVEWYQRALASTDGYWSEPYRDETGTNMLLCTFAVPLRDAQGRAIGVFGADVSLDWLHQRMLQMDETNTKRIRLNKYSRQQAYSFIVGSTGSYIAHPDKSLLLRDKFMAFGIKAQHEGYEQTELDGQKVYVFYKALAHTGWTLGFVVPRQMIWETNIAFALLMLLAMALGLMAVSVVCRISIWRATRPLKMLAESADEVARGNFNAALPDNLRRNDEIRLLRDSFSNMQQSLTRYIDDLKTTTAAKASIESELAVARHIQMAILPASAPPHPRTSAPSNLRTYSLHASLMPARAVGGDFYDFFERDGRLYFCIGDVSGKGVPAALVMTMTFSAFRLMAESETEPERIVSHMNESIAGHDDLESFITLFVGILDLGTGRLRYCNAGHKQPFLNAKPLPVDRNLPVGVMPDWSFTAQETVLAPGSMLFIYTDGLTEAEDNRQSLFGASRMRQIIEQNSDDPRMLIETMEHAVHDFVGSYELSDDLTMLALRYMGRTPVPRTPAPRTSAPRTLAPRTPAPRTPAPRTSSLTLPCDTSQTERLGEFMEQVCSQAGLDAASSTKLNIAVEEAVVNVMSYAYPADSQGEVRVDADVADGCIVLTVSDSGQPFDPTTVEPADTSLDADDRPIGGLGIHLMRRYTDNLQYERRDGRNVLTMTKKLR